jgi:hypothetical protein
MCSRLSIFLLPAQMRASTRLTRSAVGSQYQPHLEAQIQPAWARIGPHAHGQRRPAASQLSSTPLLRQCACSSPTRRPTGRALLLYHHHAGPHPHQPRPHASSPTTGGSRPPPPRRPAPRRRGPEQPSRRPGSTSCAHLHGGPSGAEPPSRALRAPHVPQHPRPPTTTCRHSTSPERRQSPPWWQALPHLRTVRAPWLPSSARKKIPLPPAASGLCPAA